MDNSTAVENIFITEFMPGASELCTKVYLYGLYLCRHLTAVDNDIEIMSKMLNLTPSDIMSAFTYWQELGLVMIVRFSPPEVRYLSLRHAPAYKKYKPSKYSDFNIRIQEILSGRMISPNEYNEYYSLIETCHFEPEAVLLIAKYCATLKGADINYPYITAVARNWAGDGVLTVARVEERLMQYDSIAAETQKVLKALKVRKFPDIDDRQLFIKWTKDYGFDTEAVLYVAALPSVGKGGTARLDQRLKRYYESKLISKAEIEYFESRRDELNALARKINRTLGVYYESVDYIAETYISNWTDKGYEEDALLLVAEGCFKSGVKNLEGMDARIQKLYEKGIVSYEGLIQHLAGMSAASAQVSAILEVLGLKRAVTGFDRDNYRTWTYSWGFTDEIILYAASLSQNADNKFAYLNKILSDWRDKGFKTLDEAKRAPQKTPAAPVVTREYTKEEYASLVANLDDLEF